MNGEAAYYCVIQYCPDRGREESANVGVLVCAPASQRVKARVGPLPARARQFFGLKPEQAAAVNAAGEALAHLVNSEAIRIDSVDALQNFVTTRANDIRLTAPRLMKVIDFPSDLAELYGELVESVRVEPAAHAVLSRDPLPPKLFGVFTRLSLTGRVQTPGKVRVPVLGRDLDIPYAYQNGVLNLVKPQLFSAGKRTENRALQLAGEAQLLERHAESGARRLIVVAGPGSAPNAEVHAAQLLCGLGVKFVAQADADAFADEVEQQAH
jgi:hypothetical protein